MKQRQLLQPLLCESYRRLYRTLALGLPPALLYYSLWLPQADRLSFLASRIPLWLLTLVAVYRSFSQTTYRCLTLAVLTALMAGNALNVQQGAPCLVRTIAQTGFVLHGFLELEQGWTLFLNGLLACWVILAEHIGGLPPGPQIPLMVLFGAAQALVWFRRRSLYHLADLLIAQLQLNQRNQQAVEVLADYNALLALKVEERKLELRTAEARLRQAYQERQLLHQQQEELHAQWLQAQRIGALARFAQGLAHSLSNTVTCIWACLPELRADDPEALADISQACQAAHGICRRMSLAGGGNEFASQRIDLNRLLENSRSLLLRAVPNPIQFELDCNDCLVLGDPAALDQVIWNLTLNAAQASMPDSPIRIITDSRPGRVLLTVADQGCGMDPIAQQRVFEPFYTTRPGAGHGLGLAIVRQAADGLGASLQIHSQPGQGTSFEVDLPAAPPGRVTEQPQSPPPAGARRKILLIEDQEALGRLIGNYLRKQEYQVETFLSAEAAGQARPGFDLLITDVHLPGRDGVELAQEWATQDPSLRVLFISGYPFEASTVPIESSRWLFLPKPFKLTELLEYLNRLA